jgi:hypothetical protein
MSNKAQSAKRYEVVPASLVSPQVPLLATDALGADLTAAGRGQRGVQALREVGWRTLVTNIREADTRTRALITECQRRIEIKEPWALVELLDQYPGLLEHDWVRMAMAELIRAGEFKRRRGRPHARYNIHPLVVVAMVEALKAGDVAYDEKAFFALEGYGVLSYSEAKRLYHQGRRDERFQPILLTFESGRREVSEDELQGLEDGAVRPQIGRPVRLPTEDPIRGKGETVLEAFN